MNKIMKKEYISPKADCFQIELASMIAASQFSPEEDSQSITVTETETDEFTSRRSSVWDDAE